MAQIQAFEDIFYKSLKSVEAIVQNGKDVIYAKSIIEDIGVYQGQMLQIANKDPKLLIVAIKTEAELVQRTLAMSNYIYQTAIVGTDVNLMDNKQRLELLKHVITELREMRVLAFSVVRQMRTAERNGIMATLAPGTFKYKDTRAALVKEVLRDYKVN